MQQVAPVTWEVLEEDRGEDQDAFAARIVLSDS